MTKEEFKVKAGIVKDKVVRKAEDFAYDFRDWWYKNRDYVIVLAPVAIGGLKIAHKGISKHAEAKVRKDLVEKRVWDPSRGCWYEVRRPMNNKQRLRLDELKSKGFTTGEALRMMGILK